jgi:hypothetical protein
MNSQQQNNINIKSPNKTTLRSNSTKISDNNRYRFRKVLYLHERMGHASVDYVKSLRSEFASKEKYSEEE